MNKDWIDLLVESGANETIQDFGDPAVEISAVARETIVSPCVNIGLIQAVGEDAESFLHNLLTNDIKGIAPHGLQRAGFCTPKGRLLADFLIWHGADGLCLQLSADILPGILKKLSMYVLRSKVKLTDATAEYIVLGLSGPTANTLLAKIGATPPAPMHIAPFPTGIVIGLSAHGFQLVIRATEAIAVWKQLLAGARPVGVAAWQWLDIAAGIPHISVPTQEQFVPQMINFELIGGVGFKKGCYPGQEIVARTEYLGKIKKRMVRARLAEGTVAVGDSVYAPETGEQACGSVVTTAPSPVGGTELLAVLPSSAAKAGEVYLRSPNGPRLALLELPYQTD